MNEYKESRRQSTIKSEETVKLFGVTLDNELNFDTHISNLCKKAAAQLNVLKRLRSFIGFEQKKVLVQRFVDSNFNYCPLVWYFSSMKSLQKIEKLPERALRFLYNDHKSSYNSLRADFGYRGGEKRKKLQSLRNGVSFLVLDHMTAMSYLPQYCVILRERRQGDFQQNRD